MCIKLVADRCETIFLKFLWQILSTVSGIKETTTGFNTLIFRSTQMIEAIL